MDFPDIGKPTLKQETMDNQTSIPQNLTDEQKRLRAIQIAISRGNSLCEKQKEISNGLQISNEEFQKTNDELVKIQQALLSIQRKIGSDFEKLSKIQEDLRELYKILRELTSLDSVQTTQLAQKVIEGYEAKLRTDINNSVIKLFIENKYSD